MNEESVKVDINALMIQALQELNLKVESLRARVEQLENPLMEDDIQEWIKVNKWS